MWAILMQKTFPFHKLRLILTEQAFSNSIEADSI